jgi:hypothetical protein
MRTATPELVAFDHRLPTEVPAVAGIDRRGAGARGAGLLS